MNPILMTLALAAALTVFTYSVALRLGALMRLRPEHRLDRPWQRLGVLLKVGFGQSRLIGREHERSSGAMHFFIFWGFVILGLREIIVFGEAFSKGFQELLPLLGSDSVGGYLYTLVYNVFEAIVLCMVVFALYRRIGLRPQRLDLNIVGNVILFLIIGVVGTDLLYDAAKFNLIGLYGYSIHHLSHPVFGTEMAWAPFARLLAWLMAGWGEGMMLFLYQFCFWGHILVILVFLNLLPATKHMHILTALPNVFLATSPEGYPHTPIPLLNVEDEKAWEEGKLGIDRLEHLTWKQGLDLYTCTECGRCYDICPTYVTGKPLTLKWFNDSLHDHLREEEGRLLRTGHTDESRQLVGDVIGHDTLWACTTCRACEEVCPVTIEHVPRIIGMRQAQTLMHEAQPEELNNTFRGLERNGNPWGLGYDKRADWAKGLDIPILTEPPAEDVDVVMWVGCMGAFDARSQKIAQATGKLLQKAGVKFAILGTAEKCTGDLARRSGNEMLYQMLARENVETLNTLKVRKIVTQCPHCLNSLSNEYPQLEGRYEVFHHSQYLARLVEEGRLTLDPQLEGTVTFHDPCYLGRYNREYDAPRALLARSSRSMPVEMRRSRNESFCCGAGGARMWMEEKIGTRVNEERVRQAYEVGATTIATACPFCMTMISDGVTQSGREGVQVLDIAEIVLQSLRETREPA
ncbi:MAG: (Fe-S)-binding protein [Candidatus Lambdaproteobacteria bacterium]|nr:(Fe-S)-binding protein [Candidatus Lambdaproteobacteria bacterium]